MISLELHAIGQRVGSLPDARLPKVSQCKRFTCSTMHDTHLEIRNFPTTSLLSILLAGIPECKYNVVWPCFPLRWHRFTSSYQYNERTQLVTQQRRTNWQCCEVCIGRRGLAC